MKKLLLVLVPIILLAVAPMVLPRMTTAAPVPTVATYRQPLDADNPIFPVSGHVTETGFIPGEIYEVQWWDTYMKPEYYDKPDAQILQTQYVQAQEDGSVVLEVLDLGSDVAVQILPAQAAMPPTVDAFLQDGGVGEVDAFYDFSVVYSDLDGVEDITWLHLWLDRLGAEDGLAVAYHRPSGRFVLMGRASCKAGQNRMMQTGFAEVDCRYSNVVVSSTAITVTWSVGIMDCFPGGCGQMKALAAVKDKSGELTDALAGVWTLALPAWSPY